VPRGAKSRMRRTETLKPIWIKFCKVVDIPDKVTYTNFGDHRLRGFWVAGGQISALPCECVMTHGSEWTWKYEEPRLKMSHEGAARV